jgi:hypothetical protein
VTESVTGAHDAGSDKLFGVLDGDNRDGEEEDGEERSWSRGPLFRSEPMACVVAAGLEWWRGKSRA